LELGSLTVEEAAKILERIGGALDEAHAEGIIHRDLKPGNILLDKNSAAYLADFGIVKLTEASAAFTGSAINVTTAYMSPEQARGKGELDGRSDIYALGTILYEMLTGELPYEADTPMGQVMMHIIEPVPRILEVKPDLQQSVGDVISKSMAKDPEERYPTASALATALRNVAKTSVIPETMQLPEQREAEPAIPETVALPPEPDPEPSAEEQAAEAPATEHLKESVSAAPAKSRPAEGQETLSVTVCDWCRAVRPGGRVGVPSRKTPWGWIAVVAGALGIVAVIANVIA